MPPILLTNAESGSEQWLQTRRSGIGASEAAAACGGYYEPATGKYIPFDPWRQPRDIYHAIRGEGSPPADNDAMAFGRFMEPAIVRFYEHKTGQAVRYPMGVYRHAQWAFMLATPDGQVSDFKGIEVKTCGWETLRDIDDSGLEHVVPQYLFQCQQQMAVMEWDQVDLTFLCDRRLRIYTINRNERMIALIAEREAELWDRIQRGDPPPVNLDHQAAMASLHRAYQKSLSPAIKLSDEANAAYQQYLQLKASIRDHEDQAERLLAQIVAEIGDAAAGVLSNGRALRKRINKSSITLRETQSAGLIVAEKIETIESRLDAVRRYLGQRGFVKASDRHGGQVYLRLASPGGKVAVVWNEPAWERECNESNDIRQIPVIRIWDTSVSAIQAASRAVDSMSA